ncbi:bromodomain adjacent to zinc finger domain protein 1A [Diabrotica virgifera virgifera]|uniref:Bromodomain adjacent to zinc finger domain protein 1A n=1 Tax=Diabrotica virgifera virgifera TaxID=50390 RepID=A0A6P7FTT0_DIAVI|nr:bromodomain adjacent to zinc finger domain protein 1A [Diabrotica virgifera virgifera]
MPLLKKMVFEKHSINDYLRDDEEVFYCEITNEIFRDYEEFSERMFLYNSMVWTCCMTGKQNLTYQEALESEDNARQCLKEFPIELRLPILFLASKTHRTSFGDMTDDVFNFVKDRYFTGENLETSFTGSKWKDSHVLQVIAPPADTIKSPKNGNKTDTHFWPPANLFKYEIEHLDAEDNDISEIMIVDCNQIRRRKGSFNRDKCKLFLRQYVEHDSKGIFGIKPAVIEELGINKIKFDQIFDGPLPNFEVSKEKEKKPSTKKKLNQEKMSKYLTKTNGDVTKMPAKPAQNTNAEENKVNLLEEMKKREEEFKIKQQLKEEQRIATKKRHKEESILLNNAIKKWMQPKEDIELENQKKLPDYMPVKSKIPEKYFGEVLMVMEFIQSFSKILSTKNFFPKGVNLELFERALNDTTVTGVFIDMIQMFLTALFNCQDEESNQYKTYSQQKTALGVIDDEDISVTDATRLATMASNWSKKHQGIALNRLPLYSVTISEILRLHLLSSGALIENTGAKWRFAQRGGYTSEDDPGLHLRLHHPEILKALSTHNVVELPMNQKLKILDCLMNQLLTYANVRDIVEDRLANSKKQSLDMKAMQLAEKKREQEYRDSKQKLEKELKGEPDKLKNKLDMLERVAERQRFENNKKTKKMMESLYDGQTVLGTDRAYRKYLKLNSVPAIFVNDEEEHAGICNDSVCGQNTELVDASRQQLLQYMRKKLIVSSPKSPSKRKMNGTLVTPLPLIEDENNAKELLMCTANPETCPVHSKSIERVKWSVIYHDIQLQEVEDRLNKRGIREGELLQVIQNYKERLEDVVTRTPSNLFNPEEGIEEVDDSSTRYTKKPQSNLGYPNTMSTSEVLENVILDNILEIEYRIFGGVLGTLQVKNREQWRKSLSLKLYDELETKIKAYVKRRSDRNSERPETPEIKAPLRKYHDPGTHVGTGLDVEMNGESDSIPCSTEHVTRYIKKSVKALAIALAQVARGIDPKYLKKPLGSAGAGKNDKLCDRLDNWEQSLLASTSYSQVCLHYATLDSCIMWSRSALKARCRICRRPTDSENMLLCDNCNLGHHLYCLKPKLTSIPKGDWFCDGCKKEKEQETKLLNPDPVPWKKRRIFKDENMEEEEDEESEDEESDEEDKSSSEEECNGFAKFELCKTCGSGGELISCEKCSSTFHIECCEPPLRRPPRGLWTCHLCKGSDNVSKSSRERSNSESSDEISLSTRKNRKEDTRDDLPLHNVALQELLVEVIKHADAWAFLRPVQKTEVKDYYEIITKPMDFGTIKYKLNMGKYSNDGQLMEDAVLVFENCSRYNESESEVYKCGERLLKFFKKKAKELGLTLPQGMTNGFTIPVKKRRIN